MPIPFPFGDLSLQQIKKLKKLKKKKNAKKGLKKGAAGAAAAATSAAVLGSGNPDPGFGSTIPLANPAIESGASFSGPLTVLGFFLIGASIVMALLYFQGQNNQQRSDRASYRYYDNLYTAGKVLPWLNEHEQRYQ